MHGPRFRVCTGGSSEYIGEAFVNELLPTTSWSFVAATYDGSEVKLYINGTLKSAETVSGTINTNSLPLRIGADNEVTPSYFNGKIDEVRIYNGALSASDVQALYSAQIGCIANAPDWTGGWTNIGLGSQQGQSFLTNSSQIFNVDVDILTGNPGNGNKTIIMKILSPTEDVLAQIAKDVSDGFNGWLGFDIRGGLSVNSGTTLRIQIKEATGPTTFG